MKTTSSNRSTSVSEQAAEWYVELDEPPYSDEKHRLFLDWLKKSPQHIEEFLAIAGLERTIANRSSSMAELVEEVRAATSRDAVAFVGAADRRDRHVRGSSQRSRSGRLAWAAGAGLATVTAVAFLAVKMPGVEAPAVSHRTELGEQRSIALGDGSIMTLNTLTEAVVQFDDDTRRVTLVNGEAMFEVTADPQRPFVVDSGDLSVSVVGTKFSVYRNARSTRIAVVDGVVMASATRDERYDIELRGGDVAIFDVHGELRRDETFDLERAIAWTERRLVFENTRLADVVSEFNRYNRIQLRIDDARLADEEVTIGFNAHDVNALIAFLELAPDIRVEQVADTIQIGRAPEAR